NKEYLISKIRHVLKYSSEKEYYKVEKIVSHDNGEISIEELVDTYYNKVENYFQSPASSATNHSDQKEIDEYLQNGEIASELKIMAVELSDKAKENLRRNEESRRKDSNYVKLEPGEKITLHFDPEKIEPKDVEFDGKKSIRYQYTVTDPNQPDQPDKYFTVSK